MTSAQQIIRKDSSFQPLLASETGFPDARFLQLELEQKTAECAVLSHKLEQLEELQIALNRDFEATMEDFRKAKIRFETESQKLRKKAAAFDQLEQLLKERGSRLILRFYQGLFFAQMTGSGPLPEASSISLVHLMGLF